MYNLTGRRVLITGGSRGLGAAIAKAFAAEGCQLALTYLNAKDKAEEVADGIKTSTGRQVEILQGDLSLIPDCKRTIEEAVKSLGGLDIVIHNAGNTKVAPFGDIHALSEEDWDYTWNMLVKSNVFLFQAALPHLKANADGGVYLMQSSIAGLMQNGSSMAYSVCRAAQLHLNRCLAETQGPEIRVNAVCPGLVETERGAAAFNEQQRQGFREMAKLKRITVPEEIASAMVFAAQNTGMTGERIRVDSGMVIT